MVGKRVEEESTSLDLLDDDETAEDEKETTEGDDDDDDFIETSEDDLDSDSDSYDHEDMWEAGFEFEMNPDGVSYEEVVRTIGKEKKTRLSDAEMGLVLRPCCCSATDAEDVCIICQHNGILKEVVRLLPCAHLYHAFCITRWLHIKNVCPICGTQPSPP